MNNVCRSGGSKGADALFGTLAATAGHEARDIILIMMDYFIVAQEFETMQYLISSWEEENMTEEEQLRRIKIFIDQSIDYYHELNEKGG